MQHSALPSGMTSHCATTTSATYTYRTPWHWHLLQITYAELTTSTSPTTLRNLPLAASAYFIGILDVLRGHLIIVNYVIWLSNREAYTKLKCRGLQPPLLQLHLLMLTPANIKPNYLPAPRAHLHRQHDNIPNHAPHGLLTLGAP